MKKAKIIASAPRFYVENVEETLNFYTTKLNFLLINKVEGFYGMVQRDGFQIHFSKFNSNFPNKNQKQHVLLWIPEIDLFWEEIKNNGLHIIEPITLKPYGNREFVLKDNDGNLITVCD